MGLTRINQIVSAWVCLDNLTIFSFVRVTWTHTDCFPRPPYIALIPSKCSSQAKTWSIIRNHTHSHSHTQTRVNREERSHPVRKSERREKGKEPVHLPIYKSSSDWEIFNHICLRIHYIYKYISYTHYTMGRGEGDYHLATPQENGVLIWPKPMRLSKLNHRPKSA